MKKILIIEDEEILLDVLERKLTNSGYEVLVARDGDEGLEKMKEAKPDLILLDIVMPKKDGFEVLTKMREDKDLSDLSVMVISNSGQPVEIDRALKLGVKDYLIKTEFDPEEVIVKVNKIFGNDNADKNIKEKISQTEQPQEKKNKDSAGSGKTILIVEDDRFLRELLAKKLKNEGFEISVAIDGEEALKRAKEDLPALILLDLILPGIGGFEVLRQIKKDPSEKVKGIPVIILSNLGQRDDVEKGINLGAVDFLVKAHFTPGEIIDKIRQVLGS